MEDQILDSFSISDKDNLMSFSSDFTCLPTSLRSNIKLFFQMIDIFKPYFSYFFSLLIINTWFQLLQLFLDWNLLIQLVILLLFGYLLDNTNLEILILSSNLLTTFNDKIVINKKLAKDLHLKKVVKIVKLTILFILSTFSFVSKYNGGLQRIYYLSYSRKSLINDYITSNISSCSYTSLQQIFEKVLTTRRYKVVIKWGIKSAFQNLPIALYIE